MSKKDCCCTPQDTKTETQLTSSDQLVVEKGRTPKGAVGEKEVEEANLIVNPDADSMESRG